MAIENYHSRIEPQPFGSVLNTTSLPRGPQLLGACLRILASSSQLSMRQPEILYSETFYVSNIVGYNHSMFIIGELIVTSWSPLHLDHIAYFDSLTYPWNL